MGAQDSAPYARNVGRTVVFALLPKGAGGAQDCAPNVRLWGEPSCSPFCRRAPEAHKTVRPTSGLWGEPSCSPLCARAYGRGWAHKTVRPTPGMWGEPSCSPLCRRAPEAHKTVRPTSGRGANRRVRPSAEGRRRRTRLCAQRPIVGRTVVFAPLRAGVWPRMGAQDSAPYARNVRRTVASSRV